MAKLRKISTKTYIALLFVFTVAAVSYFILSFRLAPDYSATPEQVMEKLQIAILQGDESKVASLFVDRATFQKFMQVPVNSVNSKVFSTSLKRTTSQSSLQAWNNWFMQYGASYIKCRSISGSDGIGCIPSSNGGFAFRCKFVKRGYLIDNFSFSI